MVPLRAGSVFAKGYEIVRQISAGGMGIVYEVIHLGTRRRRALKVMLAHIVSDPLMRERFSLEAVVTADIESEYLTEIFDAGVDEETNCPYLVMELLRGEDLAARLRRGERTTATDTLVLIGQVLRGLEKTHAQNIVHRDLKPDNLFLTQREDGSPRIKILDFGIAKLIKTDLSGPQATTKTFGTPYYMAREQVTGESALIGPRSDLYAVAQIVYSLLVGVPYFEDDARSGDGNVLALLMAVGRGATEPAAVRAKRRGVVLPAAFDAWFARATSIEVTKRHATARELGDTLTEVLREGVSILDAAALPPAAVQAGSDRVEDSLRDAVGVAPSATPPAAVQQALHQTGGAQSITAATPSLPKKRGVPIVAGAGLLLLAALGAGVFVLQGNIGSRAGSSASHDAAAAASPVPSETPSSTARSTEPSVMASTQPSSAPAASADAAPSASAGADSAPTTSNKSLPVPRTGTTPNPAGGGTPVWETR